MVRRHCNKASFAARRQRGLSLVELMFTLFIAAVPRALGVPAFKDIFVGAKVSSISNDLVGSVQFARSEAIKRNIPITLCRTTDGTACDTDTDCGGGWIVIDAATASTFTICRASPVGKDQCEMNISATGSVYVTAKEATTCP